MILKLYKKMVDIKELEHLLDDALSKETTETLTAWLDEERRKDEESDILVTPYVEIMNVPVMPYADMIYHLKFDKMLAVATNDRIPVYGNCDTINLDEDKSNYILAA